MIVHILIAAEAVSAAILAVLLYGAVFEGFWKSNRTRYFARCVVATFVGSIFDMLSWICYTRGETGFFRTLSIGMSFACSALVAAAFVKYSTLLIGEKCKVDGRFMRGLEMLLIVSSMLMLCGLALGRGGGMLFEYTGNNGISQRPFMYLVLISAFAYLYVLSVTIRKTSQLGSHDALALSMYCIIPLIGIFSGTIAMKYDFTYVALSISIVLMFVMLQFGRATEQNRQLIAQREELIRSKTFAGYFFETFMSAYYVDVSRNSFQIFRQREHMKDSFNHVDDYLATARKYISEAVLEEDRSKLEWIADLDGLRNWISKGEQAFAVFTDTSYEPPRHVRLVALPGEDANHVAIGFTDVEEEFLEEENKKQQIEELLEKTRKTSFANMDAVNRAMKMLQSSTPLQDLRPLLDIARDRFAALNCFVISVNEDFSKALAKKNWHVGISLATVDGEAELPLEADSNLVRLLKAGDAFQLPSSEYSALWGKAGLMAGKPLVPRKLFVVGVPVVIAGRLWGSMNMTVSEKNLPSEIALGGFVRIGNILGSVIERQVMYGKLTAALDEAKVAARAKSTFLATMSHEIRTPLNAVIGFAEFLRNDNLPAKERKQYLEGISKSSNALLALINDILDISKIEAGMMDVADGRTDFHKLLDEVRSIFGFRVLQKGIELKIVIDAELPLLALREERMRQILINLVGNAVKFTEKGHVVVSVSYQDEQLCIKISDTGIGISSDKLDTIFDPFRQDGGVRGGKVYQGTGLGLPICKRLVESIGGNITVESRVGDGSVFTVTIPAVAVAEAQPLSDEPQSVTKNRKKINLDELEVVLVDDVPMNLLILRKFVEKVGVPEEHIKSFSGARDALDALRELKTNQDKPQRIYVLTDMWMPDMTGEDLAKAIHADKSLDGVSIFAVTADADSSGNFNMSLFRDVITKPITGSKLAAILS